MSATEPDVPSLRFPEFAGPWHSAHGGDAFAARRARGEPGLPLYAVTIDSGMVRRDSLEREILSNAADEANLRACQGDIVYNMMRMWQGAMGRAPEDCMVSPAYVVLAPKPQISSRFFEHWFKRSRSIHWLWAYSHGLTNDRLRLYYRDFARVPMRFPDRAEQQKIADFLGGVDRRLELYRVELEALEVYKRGLLHKLFSQEVRFKDANGLAFSDWTAAKLGDLFDWLPTNNLSRDRLTDEGPGIQNIHYGDIHRRLSSRFLQSREAVPYVKEPELLGTLRDALYCRPGDVVIADASEDYADIGKAIEIIEVEPLSMIAGLHTILARPRQGTLALGFAAYLFQSAPLRRQIRRVAQGISVLGLGKSHLAKLEISIPSLSEQARIAELLGALDQKIDGVRAQADQLRTFKVGLLQKMFV